MKKQTDDRRQPQCVISKKTLRLFFSIPEKRNQ